MATAISGEARAQYNEFMRRGKRNVYRRRSLPHRLHGRQLHPRVAGRPQLPQDRRHRETLHGTKAGTGLNCGVEYGNLPAAVQSALEASGKRTTVPGDFTVWIGGGQPNTASGDKASLHVSGPSQEVPDEH